MTRSGSLQEPISLNHATNSATGTSCIGSFKPQGNTFPKTISPEDDNHPNMSLLRALSQPRVLPIWGVGGRSPAPAGSPNLHTLPYRGLTTTQAPELTLNFLIKRKMKPHCS